MSPSSTGDSPPLAMGSNHHHFNMPNRESFTIEMPNATLTAIPNGTTPLKSPNDFKMQRTPSISTPSISREGILGAAQKARNASQITDAGNGVGRPPSDEGSNPLKRRNTATDVGVDYPRRRATIAVLAPRLLVY